MSHVHDIVDTDSLFRIDPVTRVITTDANKIYVVQHDHNSERFTFQIPKYVDGHDMSLCNRIEVHYSNVTRNKKQKNDDMYIVKPNDYRCDDNDMFFFSWLMTSNATQLAGFLKFTVTFVCLDDDGTVAYEWSTAMFENIQVLTKLENVEIVKETYPDLYNQLKQEIIDSVSSSGSDIDSEEVERIVAEYLTANPPAQGEDGEDGVSPTVDITAIDDGYKIDIEDTNGIKTFNVMNGKDGYTPVKGVDYFTEADISEVASRAAELVPSTETPNEYVLPVGGAELGGVKNGGNVNINSDGTMTAPTASTIEVDTTLSESGKAADAKTVGDAIYNIERQVASGVTDEQVETAVSDYLIAHPVDAVGWPDISGSIYANYFDKSKQNPANFTETGGGVLCEPVYLPLGTYCVKGYYMGGWNNTGKITNKDGTTTIIPRNSGVSAEYSGINEYEWFSIEITDSVNYVQFRVQNTEVKIAEFLENCVISAGDTPLPFTEYYAYGTGFDWLKVYPENILDGTITTEKLDPAINLPIQDSAVTNAKLADSSVTISKIAEGRNINYFDGRRAMTEGYRFADTDTQWWSHPVYLPVGKYTATMVFSFNDCATIVHKDGTVTEIKKPDSVTFPSLETWLENPPIYTFEITENDECIRLMTEYGTEFSPYSIVAYGMILPGEYTQDEFPHYYVPYGVTVPWMKITGDKIEPETVGQDVFPDNTISYTKMLQDEKYLISNPFVGKKLVTLGDSIVNGGLTSHLKSALNCADAVNYGRDGSRIARLPDQETASIPLPISERYVDMDDDADLIVVSCGTNDFRGNCPVGTVDDADNTTLLGALKILCDGLIDKYGTDKTIIFCTPTKRNDGNSENTNGLTLGEFSDEIKNYIENYTGFLVFDAYRLSGLNPYNETAKSAQYADGLHLTDLGYQTWVRKLANFITINW